MARLTSALVCAAALVCLAFASDASAQSPPPPVLPPPNLNGNNGVFSGFNETAYNFVFQLPNATTTATVANTSPVHLPSGIRSNLFSIRPCSYATVPHYHANAAEYFFAVQGKTRVFVYVNGKLIEHTIAANADVSYGTHIAPKGQLHWYFNDECERSVMLAVLNPPEGVASQFAGYFTLPKVFTDGVMTAADVAALIATGTVRPVGSGPTAFDLTNNCLKKCKKCKKDNEQKYNPKHGRGYYSDDDDYNYQGHKKSLKKRNGKGRY